jgi:predicted dinucleotide-binding enzyme
MKKIGILGTGDVGNRIATRLVALGYEVKMGSRTANNEKTVAWAKQNGEKASIGTFADVADFGDIIFNCVKGENTLSVFEQAGLEKFSGKIIVDITMPLDLPKGFPFSLLPQYSNTTSLSEEIQKLIPDTKVTKSLNIVNNELMANGEKAVPTATMLLAGNDAQAKEEVKAILTQFGWKDILDLGGIQAARGMESFSSMWAYVYQATQNANFTITINR